MKKSLLSFLLTAVFLGISPAVSSATIDVSIKDLAFQPQTVTVNVGDTVKWKNVDAANYGNIPHTVTSGTNCAPDGGWDSPKLLLAQSFSFTFSTPGTYPYFCKLHCASAHMMGTIIVSDGSTLSTPLGQNIITFVPESAPVTSTDKTKAKPVGIGPLAIGGNTITFQANTVPYQAPMDFFAAFRTSTDLQTIVNLAPDLSFQKFSMQQIEQALATGQLLDTMQPWLANTTGPSNAILVPSLSTSEIPPGQYTGFLMAAVPGSLSNFDLYQFDFTVGVPITMALNGTQEVPQVDTPGAGTVSLAVNSDTGVITGLITFAGLKSNAVFAHIRQAPAGANGSPIIPLTVPSPLATSGTIPISATLTAAQLAALKNNELYLNIQTVDHGDGEIRGQIVYPTGAPNP
jgi:plastocyanin